MAVAALGLRVGPRLWLWLCLRLWCLGLCLWLCLRLCQVPLGSSDERGARVNMCALIKWPREGRVKK